MFANFPLTVLTLVVLHHAATDTGQSNSQNWLTSSLVPPSLSQPARSNFSLNKLCRSDKRWAPQQEVNASLPLLHLHEWVSTVWACTDCTRLIFEVKIELNTPVWAEKISQFIETLVSRKPLFMACMQSKLFDFNAPCDLDKLAWFWVVSSQWRDAEYMKPRYIFA